MSTLETARFEVKLTLPIHLEAYLSGWIGAHQLGFHTTYPQRQVNNIYFDTYDLDAFAENLSGVAKRSKLRLRWYGEQQKVMNAQLELKQRCGKLGWKHSSPMNFTRELTQLSWSALYSEVFNQASSRLKTQLLTCSIPSVLNSYTRNYWVSADNNLRITVDSNLCFYDQRISSRLRRNNKTSITDTLVLEIKTLEKNRDLLKQTLQSIRLPLSRCSKYAIGIQSLAM